MMRITLAAALLMLPLAAQTTWYVDVNATPPGSGSQASPFPTIQPGINAAQNGDTVLVAPGLYYQSIDLGGKAITIKGDQGAAMTTVRESSGLPAIALGPSTTSSGPTIEGVTIEHSHAGVYVDSSAVTINACRILRIGGGPLAAVDLHNSPVSTITNCFLHGGGGGSAAIASYGSGSTGAVIVQSCQIVDYPWGSGIAIDCDTLSVSNSLIARNGSNINVTVATSFSIENCTLADPHQYSTLYVQGANASGVIRNSIIWGSVAEVHPTTAVSHTNYFGGLWPGPGNIAADPLFIDPSGDYHLASSSPCRDAGDPTTTGLPATDIDGTPRIANGVVDMGADEVPAMPWVGSSEDIDLYVATPGVTDPLQSYMTVLPGELLIVKFDSPGGAFLGTIPVLIGQLYYTGSPFPNTSGLPYLHIDVSTGYDVMYGSLELPSFLQPGLSPQGVQLYYQIPPGLNGFTLRMQFFCATGFANNGFFAASDARDVEFL